LKIKKAASPNATTAVCTVSDLEYLIQNQALPLGMLYVSLYGYYVDYFEHHIQNVLLPLGMLNKEHFNPPQPVYLSLFMFES
jgi:hypothetical protein